ncbi:CidA/LrgA family protein [Paludibacterium paludis]|uniref:Murein hydrolase transporter LrgA n=1 Tax=Paludibacterium paludis TaxID=1225769 RepID=A0A918P5Q3_9NEIS|nr:CidA/LrgA family protein [Paludibacterium paludis]GGY27123.1 murein hydrolase transporter LrgA [Paludibacterium paludis]
MSLTLLESAIWLIGFQLLGEALARFFGLPVPGAVIGMLLLFIVLVVKKDIPDALRENVPPFLAHMSLLFIPAGAAVLHWKDDLARAGWPLLITLVVSVVATWLVSALVLKAMLGKGGAHGQ